MPNIEQVPHDQPVFGVLPGDPRRGSETPPQLDNRFTGTWLQWLFKIRDRAIRTAYLDQANLFTANQYIANETPALNLSETDRGADLKRWRLSASSEILRWAALSDDESTVTELLTLDRTGLLSVLGLLNLSTGQLKFPATQNPSADVNTLDDYEEGDWTPALTFGGASVGLTYSVQLGRYVKVGRQVTCSGLLWLTAKGASVGNAVITGLPFVIGTSNGFFGSWKFGYTGFTAGVVAPGYQTIGNTSTLNTIKDAAGVNTIMTDADHTNFSIYTLALSYMTD